MSKNLEINDQFITSAVITGPIVDGILFGPCVNKEYSNCKIKNYDTNDIRFDVEFDIEERKEAYSDEELYDIYRNSKIQNEEDEYYDRTASEEIQKEMMSYWDEMYEEEQEYLRFLQEEEDREIRLEHFIGVKNR